MADQKINELPTKTAPSTGDKMLMIGTAEEYQIDYDKLASAILDKLATKQYSELDTTAKTVLGAIDELNSNSYSLRGGTSIPANSDLNNYTTPGNYYCSSSNTTTTLINAPFKNSAFVFKVLMGNGTRYPTHVYEELITGKKAYRCYVSEKGGWKDYVYFSDDSTLFTPQNVAITNGDYGQVTGSFKRIGSILIFSFYIQLTKEYNIVTDAIFTFNTIKSAGRYDFPSFSTYDSDLRVIDLYIAPNSNIARFNIGSGETIPRNSTLFCSGAMIIADL